MLAHIFERIVALMNFNDTRKIDQKTGRAINRRLILNLIRRENGLSRSEIAERTGLSPAAVGFVVSDLLEEGFLVTGESRNSSSGRKPVPLMLNKTGNMAVGVKVTPTRLDCVLTDFAIDIIDTLSVQMNDTSPEAVVAAAASGIRTLLKTNRVAQPVLGIGMSVPGRIDPATATCIRSNRLDWDDVPIGRLLSEAVGIPTFVEDDTLAYGLAHQMFGLGQASRNFAVLAVGDGIGFATISDAKVYRGSQGNAGKVGHVLFDPTGPICECGRAGCLQAWYGANAMMERWSDEHSSSLLRALASEDGSAKSFVAEAGFAIGKHLAEWATVTDPEQIVLGGEAVGFGEAFLSALQRGLSEAYYRNAAPPVVVDVENFYWTAGAAAVAVQQIFDFEAKPIG